MGAATTLDWVHTNVCISPALTTDAQKRLVMQPYAVPRLVADVVAKSGGDGRVYPLISLPGKLMIDQHAGWFNDSPLEHMVRILVTRGSRAWITSNPNAIQMRDRWTVAVDDEPPMPVSLDNINSQVGSAIDLGTNTVSEPNPGRHWMWQDTGSEEEWIGPLLPGESVNVWYQAYLWTPPPWADNANKSAPQHEINAAWTRLQLMAFPIYDLIEGLTP